MAHERSTSARRRSGLVTLLAAGALVVVVVALTMSLFAPTLGAAGSAFQRYLPGGSAAPPTQPVTSSTVAPSTVPSSTATATQSPVSALRFPGDPGLGQMYVGESVASGDPSAREQGWGATVGVFRSYFLWNDNVELADRAARDLAAGRVPFISFHSGSTWAEVANGSQDLVLRDLMARLGALPGPVWLSMDAEPYDDQAAKGTAADFGNADKHLMSMLPSNVALVPILQAYPFDPTVGMSQDISAWYPPGSYTFVGLDTYNHRYYSPTAGNRYRDAATVLSVLDTVRKQLGRPDVPIAIAEFGTRTNPAVPGQAAQWLRDFVAKAKTMNVPAVCYFDSGYHVNDGGTPWSLDDTTDGTDGTERLNAYGPLVAAGAHLK